MRIFFAMALILALSACAPVQTVRPTPTPPANLIAACGAIPKVEGRKLADLLENHVETVTLYRECAEKHKLLSEWAVERK